MSVDTGARSGPDPAAEVAAPDALGALTIAGVRVLVAMLWFVNVGWKMPPHFGEEGGGLHLFTSWAVEYQVFAPFAWVVREVVLANFALFGWFVLLTEASLAGFLLIGLFTRFWAAVGVLQSVAITLSVLNAPHEWPWAYFLMIGAHLLLLGTAAGRTGGVDSVLRDVWTRRGGRWSRLALRLS